MTFPHVIFAISLLLATSTLVTAQDDGSYPSCIGLALATNFYFEGDVVDTASCQQACSQLFQDDGMYVTTTDSTPGLAYCECSDEGGRLCQDEVTEMTTASPPETTEEMVETTTVGDVVPGGQEESTTSAPPPPTAVPTSSAATIGADIMFLSLGLLAMTMAILV